MERLRILLLVSQVWRLRDGVKSYVPGLSEQLTKRGHEVIVAAAFSRDDEVSLMQPLATTVERLPNTSAKKFVAARDIVRRWHPDIVHYQGLCGGNAADLGLHLAFTLFPDPTMSFAITTHTSVEMLKTFSTVHLYDSYYEFVKRWVERRFDGVLGFSEYDRQLYGRARRYFDVGVGVSPEDFEGCDHPSVFERMGIPPDHRVLLFLGRLEPNKGVQYLVQAFAEARKSWPKTSLVLGGTIPNNAPRAFVDPMKREMAAVPGVYAPGFLGGHDKICALLHSDVFCLPSCHEMFPVAVLEAWAAKRPVIVGDTGGSRYMVDAGVDGFHVAFGDVPGLAEKICSLLEDDGLRSRMGDAGRRKVAERYTWPDVAERAERAYGLLA